MTDDRRQRIEQIYLDALDIPAVDRPGFLDRACAGDQALRSEVEALLALQSGAEAFLEQPAIESAARTLADILPALRPPEIPGYKIIRHLGEGGMGLVYLAEQQAPLRRLVALKVIRPGMDSLQVVARFNAERQALAQMDHPNIAAVHDAGATSDGRPFFVMEFVDGLPISEYCDRKALPTVARLELFTQVCAGVQHAHQKGVIHRDLKPSNVLVAEHDGRPVPKVIDFGTAKAIDRSAGDAVTLTAHGMVLGTIEYMSPEQAAFSRDIDTTTDVYSLGVMLYELLVGVLPFERPRPGPEGYDELRRLIRESDPERPSARLSAIAESRAGIASARQTDPDRLRRSLQGDLDWITLKALEKDRTRRYPTVAAFASDIQRFLLDQPVDARPPSAAYRIRKFTRRHRLAVAAAAMILTILAAGVAVTGSLYWQVRAALRESTYLAYTAAIAAAASDLRIGAVPEARARLLTVSETQRGWEWQHLFIQTDQSVFNFASAAPDCPSLTSGTALTLDSDGESVVLRRCLTLERWGMPSRAHTVWAAPAKTLKILAVDSRGQILTSELTDRGQWRLVLTDRNPSAAAVAFGPFESGPMCAAISPDGARIAVSRGDAFELWNTTTGRLEFTLTPPPVLPLNLGVVIRRPSCVIQFSPDGRHVATSGPRLHIWDAATGAERVTGALQAHIDSQAIAFSRKGDRLAIGHEGGVDVLDLSQASPTLRRMPVADWWQAVASQVGIVRYDHVLAAAFSPDGQTVVASGTSTTVGVWDVGQAKLVRVLSGHAAYVTSLVVSADLIYSVDTAGAVRAWTLRDSPAVVRTPASFKGSIPFSASADGSVIRTVTSDGALVTFRPVDLHQEVIPAPIDQTVTPPIQSRLVAISPEGRHVFAAERGSIRRWTIGSKETVDVSKSPDINCKGTSSPGALTVSPDGGLLAFIDRNCVAVWDASTMKQLAVFVDTATLPMYVLFRDDKTLIISAVDWNGKSPSLVRIWNWRTNRILATVEARPVSLQFVLSSDRRRIALISSVADRLFFGPRTVSIWDGDLKTEVGKLPPGDYLWLAFSPDGRRIVSVGAQETAVRVWDAERFLPLLTLQDTDSHRGGVAFTAAGQIVAGRSSGGLTIWDTQIRRR